MKRCGMVTGSAESEIAIGNRTNPAQVGLGIEVIRPECRNPTYPVASVLMSAALESKHAN